LFDIEGTTRLVQKALLVQLRKEVSLSRRVYQWLLGDVEAKDPQYLLTHSKVPLVGAIEVHIHISFPTTQMPF